MALFWFLVAAGLGLLAFAVVTLLAVCVAKLIRGLG